MSKQPSVESASPAFAPDAEQLADQHRVRQALGVAALTGVFSAGLIGSAAAAENPLPAHTSASTETGSTSEHSLSAKTVEHLVKVTGFQGLEKYKHQMSVMGEFPTKHANNIIVTIGKRPSSVSLPELQVDYEQSTAVAEARHSFTSKVTLAPHTRRAITFNVSPRDKKVDGKKTTNYMIFTPRNVALNNITAPVSVASNDGITHTDPVDNINVSLVRNQGAKRFHDAFNITATGYVTAIEAGQATNQVHVDPASWQQVKHLPKDYLTDPNGNPYPDHQRQKEQLALIGQEIQNNSNGLALSLAEQGVGYHKYANFAPGLLLNNYPYLYIHDRALSQATYHRFVEAFRQAAS